LVYKIRTDWERQAVGPSGGDGEGATSAAGIGAARKRAAVETYARHEAALRRTARRYSLCADDADDALQRGLEILLKKAPSEDPRELIRWTQTVVKHEALAVRRERERILSGPAAARLGPEAEDWVALIPATADGPPERAERRETIARSREALQALKPQELRALTLLAEGYSYAEIGEITGYSQTKINRCLAEGRERFRKLLSRSEDGRRCAEMGPAISAFCDGEAGAEEVAALREHLRACSQCRATLRAYRAAPAAAAALAPTLPLGRPLIDRAHEMLAGLAARFGDGTADSAVSQAAVTGSARGAGVAALAKALAICAGTAGGAVACLAAGVVPTPLAIDHHSTPAARIERRTEPIAEAEWGDEASAEPEPAASQPPPSQQPQDPPPAAQPASAPQPPSASGAIEYTPAPPPPPTPEPAAATGTAGGNPAGEFGP
jgi:RNA polymerase sigma factor (sigma-70 family)